MDTKPITLALIAPFAALAMAAAPVPVPPATRCEATVNAELSRVEPKETVTTHTYTVNVTTLEPCAKIQFALSTTERISKTKVKVVSTADEVTLRNGSVSRLLSYDMPNERTMDHWEVTLTGCERCEP
jgi:pyrimidine deaminase RibD-like protein